MAGVIIVAVGDPTTGSTTTPTGTPDPNAPAPPVNGADADEQAVATIFVRAGFTPVLNQPPILGTDTDYGVGGKYAGKEPDFRIEGKLFDLYTPAAATTPTSIADKVDQKASVQVNRVIVKLPDPPTGKTIAQVIAEIVVAVQDRRDTPDTGTRDDLEELIVVKPDGTRQTLFPGGGVN